VAQFGQQFDVLPMALLLRARYDRGIFPALVLKLLWPNATCSVFGSGKIVVAGAPTVDDCLVCAQIICARIGEVLGVDAHPTSFKVRNMVGTASLGYRVNLDKVYELNSGSAIYNPAVFSGLQLYSKDPKCTIVVAASGKYNITGIKLVEHFDIVAANVEALLLECKEAPNETGEEYTDEEDTDEEELDMEAIIRAIEFDEEEE
jgi:transcription initiation factor TFIID TATA-box-binding protein